MPPLQHSQFGLTSVQALPWFRLTSWEREMVLDPGKEFGLIVPPGVEIAAPSGWSALAIERVRVDESP
jgi:hypothetical protein